MRFRSIGIVFMAISLSLGCQKPLKSSSSRDDADEDSHKLDPFAASVGGFGQAIDVTAGSSCGLDPPPTSDPREVDIQELYVECGVKEIPPAPLDRETFSTKLYYGYHRVIHAGFGKAIVPLTAILDLKTSFDQSTLHVGVSVDDKAIAGEDRGLEIKGEGDLQAIKERAEKIASVFRGPAINKIKRPSTYYLPGVWKSTFCTVSKAVQLVNQRNGTKVVSSYDPAFPPNISPLARKERYEIELGSMRYFQDIKVKIEEAENSIFKQGQTLIGNVLIEKIPAETEVDIVRYDSKDEIPDEDFVRIKRKIKSDVAYRITSRFGTEEQTLALGFHLWTEYYVDTVNKNFTAVVANVGDEETMYFFRDDLEPFQIGD